MFPTSFGRVVAVDPEHVDVSKRSVWFTERQYVGNSWTLCGLGRYRISTGKKLASWMKPRSSHSRGASEEIVAINPKALLVVLGTKDLPGLRIWDLNAGTVEALPMSFDGPAVFFEDGERMVTFSGVGEHTAAQCVNLVTTSVAEWVLENEPRKPQSSNHLIVAFVLSDSCLTV